MPTDLPFNAEAEEAVIGSLLIDPEMVFELTDLAPDDFYLEKYRWVYEGIGHLTINRKPVDIVTLSAYLESLGKDVDQSELIRLMTAVPTSMNAGSYAEIITANAIKRRISRVAGEIAVLAHQTPIGEVNTLPSDALHILETALPKTADAAHLRGDDTLDKYLEHQQVRAEKKINLTSGWHSVDEWLFLEPGFLIIVAGRTGVGKTMFFENVAEHNAKQGRHVVFYHYELSHQIMLDRMMARYSSKPYTEIRAGIVDQAMLDAAEEIKVWQGNMDYVHCPSWSANRIRADLMKLNQLWGVDLVIVDYLQKMPLPSKGGLNEASLIGHVVERLKTTAEEMSIPMLVGSQVTRRYMQTETHKPKLGDLRSSGTIEEKANVVLFLHREVMDKQNWLEPDMVEIYTEKNTMGDQGQAKLRHEQGRYRFVETPLETVSLNPPKNLSLSDL